MPAMIPSSTSFSGEVLFEAKSLGTTEDAVLDGFLSRISLNSRLAKGVHVQLGHKFTGKWEKQIREGMGHVPWRLFYTQGSGVPSVKTKSLESRIFSHKHIVELVQEGFKEFQGQSPYENFKSVDLKGNASDSPSLLVRFSKNELELLVDTIGVPLNSNGFEKFDSRLQIDQITASGCIMRSLLPVINSSINKYFTLWDPFCGNGVLQLMTASIIAGLPVGSPMIPYAFRNFPIHDPQVFDEVCDALRIKPHANMALIESILGTDSSLQAVEIANRNLVSFQSQIPSVDDGTTLPEVRFERRCDAYSPPSEKRIFIMTAIPIKGDTEKKYMHFHKMVEELISENRLVGCLVVTSKWNQFRKLSHREWLTELRFFVGSREVELLKLVV